MHINDLHDELVEVIFDIHVNKHLQSRHVLLLTCRKWYNLAVGFSALWRTIACFRRRGQPRLISVNSLYDLALAINRVGNATYELELGLPRPNHAKKEDVDIFLAMVDSKWLSRCQSFTVLYLPGPSQEENEHVLERMLRHCSLDALERLSIIGPSRKRHKDIEPVDWTQILLAEAERSSPHLSVLTYSGHCSAPIILLRYPGILNRLRRLLLEDLDPPLPRLELPCLEHLGLRSMKESPLSDLVAPRMTSLCLGGDFINSDLPSSEVFRTLTRLELVSFLGGDGDRYDKKWPAPPLPALTYLKVDKGEEILNSIHASNLVELDLCLEFNADIIFELSKVQVTPRILRLDIGYSWDYFRNFASPLVIWSRLEEIHMTSSGRGVYNLPFSMEEGIAGISRQGQCYPRLLCFTMRYSFEAKGGPSHLEKQKWVRDLRRMKERRDAGGYRRLERLEVGWYWRGPSGFDPIPESVDWPVTEWTNCLLGWDEEQVEGM